MSECYRMRISDNDNAAVLVNLLLRSLNPVESCIGPKVMDSYEDGIPGGSEESNHLVSSASVLGVRSSLVDGVVMMGRAPCQNISHYLTRKEILL